MASSPKQPRVDAKSLAVAIEEWEAVVGIANVTRESRELLAFQQATFATDQSVAAVVRPGCADEVARCLYIASSCLVPMYPVSRGRNWGYGSRVPAHDGGVVLMLDRMNRITNVDEKLGFVTVEPGVSFEQLRSCLQQAGSQLVVDSPGSGSHGSIIGHALERGIAPGVSPERYAHVARIEVVLADGSLVDTGLGRFGEMAARDVTRVGPGPNALELFFQSNLGVVVSMTVWLDRGPIESKEFTFQINDVDMLEGLVDVLQDLRMDGALSANCTLLNAWRAAAYLTQFSAAKRRDDCMDEFAANELAGAAWVGSAAIAGVSRADVAAKASVIADRLRPVTSSLEITPSFGGSAAKAGHEAHSGVRAAYSRKDFEAPVDADPDRDRCGVLWCVVAVPFRGRDVRRCERIVENELSDTPFDPALALHLISPRAVHFSLGLFFDRDDPDHDDAAKSKFDEVVAALAVEGYLPYRLPQGAGAQLRSVHEGSGNLFGLLRQALDPNQVLAPGRYDF